VSFKAASVVIATCRFCQFLLSMLARFDKILFVRSMVYLLVGDSQPFKVVGTVTYLADQVLNLRSRC
jgi:hypothetical protein